MSKAIFLLDIEVELAWRVIDKRIRKEKLTRESEKVRELLGDIIQIVDKYSIPVTWGVLGHIMLDRCNRRSGVPHPEMLRPTYKWMKRDWYAYDPCKNMTEEPAFYGRDITDRIFNYALKSKTPHDIACHSFSHQLFGDKGCSEELAEAEIGQCIRLLTELYGIRPMVFIFPRDYPGHFDVLQKNSFIAFRGQIPRVITYLESGGGAWNTMRKYISLASYLISFYLGIPAPVVSPKRQNGLVSIPASMCYNKKPFVPLRLVVSKAMKGLNRAVKEKKIFHLYTHLINFGEAPDSKVFLQGFEKILASADFHRKRRELEIGTIRNIAEELTEKEDKS